eukprot:Opistho-1_new@11158
MALTMKFCSACTLSSCAARSWIDSVPSVTISASAACRSPFSCSSMRRPSPASPPLRTSALSMRFVTKNSLYSTLKYFACRARYGPPPTTTAMRLLLQFSWSGHFTSLSGLSRTCSASSRETAFHAPQRPHRTIPNAASPSLMRTVAVVGCGLLGPTMIGGKRPATVPYSPPPPPTIGMETGVYDITTDWLGFGSVRSSTVRTDTTKKSPSAQPWIRTGGTSLAAPVGGGAAVEEEVGGGGDETSLRFRRIADDFRRKSNLRGDSGEEGLAVLLGALDERDMWKCGKSSCGWACVAVDVAAAASAEVEGYFISYSFAKMSANRPLFFMTIMGQPLRTAASTVFAVLGPPFTTMETAGTTLAKCASSSSRNPISSPQLSPSIIMNLLWFASSTLSPS